MKTEANQEPPNRSLKFKNGANIRVANLDGDVKHAQSGTPTFRTKDGSSHQVSSKGGFLGRETKIRREDKDGKTSTDTFTRKFGYERDEKNDAEGNKTIRESSLFGLVSSTKKFSENGDVKVKQSKFLGLDTTQLEDAIPDPIHHLQETRNRIGRSLNKLNPVNILLSPFGGNV